MTMETIIFLLNHILTYCITVDLEKIVLKYVLGKSTGTTQWQGK